MWASRPIRNINSNKIGILRIELWAETLLSFRKLLGWIISTYTGEQRQ